MKERVNQEGQQQGQPCELNDVLTRVVGHGQPLSKDSIAALNGFCKMQSVPGIPVSLVIRQRANKHHPPELALAVGKVRIIIED